MIAPNLNLLCVQAEAYYYDILSKEGHEFIPEFVINHVKQCQHCQDRVHQLEAVLSQYEDIEPKESQVRAAVITMLRLHFSYVGKPVTCKTIRPFLPTLLDPLLEVGIPTPITAHLNDCSQCASDLEIIQKLNLRFQQLRRLSELFAEIPSVDSAECSGMREAVKSVAAMKFNNISAEMLKHMCICSVCRNLIYEEREIICGKLPEYAQTGGFPCESVSAADLFDYVVPYGLDPATDQYAKFRQSFTSHVATCSTCLPRMQHLHNTVYGIIEHAESEIVTIYHVDESARAVSKSDELYSGFPIKVDVLSPPHETEAAQSTPTVNFTDALKKKVSALKGKPLVKSGVAAAAAVFIVVALLLLNMQTAQAVTIDQIYKAIEKARNVYISKSSPDDVEPVEERWISRPLNIYMSKTGKEMVLWDLKNKVRKTKRLGTDLVEIILLSDDLIAEIEKRITGSLGLMPLSDKSEMPPGAEWNQVKSEDIKDTVKGTEIYDLTWVERKYGGSVMLRRWRVFADSDTNLPRRIEWYQRSDTENEYTLMPLIKVEYLSKDEIQAVIKKSSF